MVAGKIRYIQYFTGHSTSAGQFNNLMWRFIAGNEVMAHMLAGENLGLCTSRGTEISGGWEHIFCSKTIIQHHTVSIKEVNYLFPVYHYPQGYLAREANPEPQPQIS